MQKYRVFYSWQSDLPGSRTRSFIRECIDKAIDLAQETEAIEAERDEATTGVTGSPDIVSTLFSKIDDCDLFIADLSLSFTEDQKKEKKSPNPNVLLELGYAVKTLGWERIVCLCNKDYGEQYPFDIAHNRITAFSLECRSRKEVKSEISEIIFVNIRDTRKQPQRAKKGMATHIIGTYDTDNHEVTSALKPIMIEKQESYVLHNAELLDEARELFAEIRELTDMIKEEMIENDKPQVSLPEYPLSPNTVRTQFLNTDCSILKLNPAKETPVVWKDVEMEKTRINHWLSIDVSNAFFDIGGLKQVVQLHNLHNSKLIGTEAEKAKYEKLHRLSYNLLLLDVRTNYLKTFDGMVFIPLAIQNISTIHDTDIHVAVSIDDGEIIEPNEKLICKEYDGIQGHLCRDDDEGDIGIIAELFILPEDGFIHTEPTPYDPSEYVSRTPIYDGIGFSQPDKTEEDYKQELEEYIATTGGAGYFEFDVACLRPGECRWLSGGMLIKPVDGKVKIHYQIHSAHSAGNLSGILEM